MAQTGRETRRLQPKYKNARTESCSRAVLCKRTPHKPQEVNVRGDSDLANDADVVVFAQEIVLAEGDGFTRHVEEDFFYKYNLRFQRDAQVLTDVFFGNGERQP